jgi:RNA polymerase sigma factor (sigma-70 family)
MFLNENDTNHQNRVDLIDRFLDGDELAYSQIYKLYAEYLYAYGKTLTVPIEFVEDAIHDIFVELYSKKDDIKRLDISKMDDIKSYLFKSFRNRLFYLVNRTSKASEIAKLYISSNCEDPAYDEIWIEREYELEQLRTVNDFLKKLNPNQREAIYLRYIEGHSCDQISGILGINYQSVKNLIYRALKKMRYLTILK